MTETHKDYIQSKYAGESIEIKENKLSEEENISDIVISKWRKIIITGFIRDDSKTILSNPSTLLKKTNTIKELRFINNKLYEIPNSIYKLINLKKLIIKNNKLANNPKK